MHSALRHVLVASALGGSLLAAGAWLSGCIVESFGCTMLGSTNGLMLDVVPQTPGSYDIVVRSDVVEAQCSFTLDRNQDVAYTPCDVRRGYAYPRGGYDAAHFVLDLNGDYPSVPTLVDIEVYDSQQNLILRRTLQPVYSESYPNGPECDPEPSRFASESIDLPEVFPAPPQTDAGSQPPRDAGVRDAGSDAATPDASDAADDASR